MKYNVLLVRLSGNSPEDIFPQENRPPFDLMQAGELLKINYSIPSLIIDEQIEPLPVLELVKKCLSFKPKIVVLSCLSTKILECKEFFKTTKQRAPDITCIAVGHLATYCPKRICYPDSDVDFVIRGECQIVLSDFINYLLSSPSAIADKYADGSIFSKTSRELSHLHIIKDVDTLPIIPYTKKSLRTYNNLIPVPMAKNIIWGRLFSSYGCPNQCIFCTQVIRDTYGRNHRLRSIHLIIEEMRQLKKAGANIIEFADDNFTASEKHLLSLCHNIIENKINIPWGAHVRVDDLTYQTLLLMKRAGCIFIRCGIESGSESVITALRKTDSPTTWRQQAHEVFNWAKELNFMTDVNVILGSPGETESDIQKTKELIFELGPDILQVHSFCAYPGSGAYNNLCENFSNYDLAKMHHHNTFKFCEDPQVAKKLQREILTEFFIRISYLYKSMIRFGPYYLLNPGKTFPLIKSVFDIIK